MAICRIVTTVTAILLTVISLMATSAAWAVSESAILARKPPKLLSEYGLFADLPAQIPAKDVLPYTLNTPLFTDHARKLRFVFVPSGKPATYNDSEAFEFPLGTALIKTFAYPGGRNGPGRNLRLIETRLLLKTDRGWQAWAYLWNEEQTDAKLKITGARLNVKSETADGTKLDFTYSVPNRNQCKGCHSLSGEFTPIGPSARNLNGDFEYPDGAMNQLQRWTNAGILSGAPDPAGAPKAVDWRNEAASLDDRARAWLDVNCAHCHRREGPASNSGLFLTWNEGDPVALGIGKRPVAAGRGSGGRLYDIAPGDPDGSILLYRVESIEPGVMMPEIGRSLADHEAAQLLRAWISTLR